MRYLKRNLNKFIVLWLLGLTISVILLHTTGKREVFVEVTATKMVTETTSEPQTEPITETPIKPLGKFKLTAYCACENCCGKSDGITATGTKATQGRTIAVDPSIIPYGTTVIINGDEYVAEDTGGAINGNVIDIFFDNHDEALEFGVQYANVYVKESGNNSK